ncbi:MAG: hypothetical protein ACYC6C_14030 [Coriobacteriia bacterium]
MGYGEMIARALQSMRSRPLWLLAGLGAALYLPMFAVIIAVALRSAELFTAVATVPAGGQDVQAMLSLMRAMPWLALASLLGGMLGIPAYAFVEVGVAIHTRSFLDGARRPFGELLSDTKAVYMRALATYATLYGPLLLACALIMLLVGVSGEGFVAGLIGRGDTTGVLVSTFGIGFVSIALIVFALVAFITAIFAVRAVALDGSAPIPAIRWSLGILRSIGRRMSVMYLMIYLVQMAFSLIISMVTTPLISVGVLMIVARAALAISPQAMTEAMARDMQVLIVPLLLVSILSTAPAAIFVSAAWTAFYQRVLGRPLSGATASLAPSTPFVPTGRVADA